MLLFVQVNRRHANGIAISCMDDVGLKDFPGRCICAIQAILYANMKAPRLPMCSGGCVSAHGTDSIHSHEDRNAEGIKNTLRNLIRSVFFFFLSGANVTHGASQNGHAVFRLRNAYAFRTASLDSDPSSRRRAVRVPRVTFFSFRALAVRGRAVAPRWCRTASSTCTT